MAYEAVKQRRHFALDYQAFHTGPTCSVDLLMGTTAVWIFCRTCRVTAQLDTVGMKIDIEGSREVRTE